MDGSAFDDFARALHARRTRRGAVRLLRGLTAGGLALALGVDLAGAAKRQGGASCGKDAQCKSGKCLKSGKCACSRKFGCVQPADACKTATCTAATGRCVPGNAAKGAACNDGLACTAGDACDGAGHCAGSPTHSRCTSNDPCQKGFCRPNDANRDGDGCVFEAITTGECGAHTCDAESDCCPPDRPNCVSGGGVVYKTCDNGMCVCEAPHRQGYPHECTFAGNPSQCHQCCTNDHCVVQFADPNRTCTSGFCGCGSSENPNLCHVWDQPGKTRCTNVNSDPEHCGSCHIRCSQGEECQNGSCVFSGSAARQRGRTRHEGARRSSKPQGGRGGRNRL
jgi:hypothetical protein